MAALEKSTKANQSVVKILKIIETMASIGQPVRLKDLAREVGMPESTTLRMLASLLDNGYVTQSADSQKYSLTFKIARIGLKVQSNFTLFEIVHPKLIDLSQKCQESACLAIEENESVVYIDTVDGPRKMLQTLQKIGKRAPMYCTGVGKNLLTNYSDEQLRSRFEGKDFVPFTPRTIRSIDRLIEEVDKVRENGYAFDDEECELGARCIAVPIKDFSGSVIASISVSGPTLRMVEPKVGQILEELLAAANELSIQMGY